MASPHWKPPNNHINHDNANVKFNASSGHSFSSSPNNYSTNKSNNSSNNDSNSSGSATGGFREAGIVEKLLASYGFIQCCERQARLFFHYSQYSGNIEHLKLGDPVEFEMTYDRRTGKPIASTVVKITSEAFMAEELSSERVTGFITTELTSEREGRVAYENRGECFFLPFTKDDIEDDEILSAKDSVTFFIGTDKSGNLRARHVKLEIPTPLKHEGVICTLKDSFGFIERADVVKEIFFHSSECKDFKDLLLGDDVEFSIQIRNNKEVAVNVNKLSPGSVVFEDVSEDTLTGQIVKTIERQSSHSSSRSQSSVSSMSGTPSDPFPGRISYTKNNAEVEIPFGDRDVKGEYTLQVSDYVRFNIVTDRRDRLQHATNVDVFDDTFAISGEHREQGYVAALKDYYGFIKCLNREGTRVYFRVSEMLNPNLSLKLNDEVEFTVGPDLSSPGRLQAIRIKLLPDGTIFKNLFSPVKQLPTNNKFLPNGTSFPHMSSDSNSKQNGVECETYQKINEFPLIDLNTELETERKGTALNANEKSAANANNATKNSQGIVAKSNSWSEILSQLDIGTNLSEIKSDTNKDLLTCASNFDSDQSFSQHEPLKPMILDESLTDNNLINSEPQLQSVPKSKKETTTKNNVSRTGTQTKNGIKFANRGYVVALKETFGFIEAEDGQRELFFHYSVYDGNVDTLELGQPVEYNASFKNNKLTALAVRKALSKIPADQIQSEVLTGVVTRTVRTFNPDQNEYTGSIRVVNDSTVNSNENKCDTEYEFSVISLKDINEFIQKGDAVKFQIGFNTATQTERAVNIKPIRTKHQGIVECIKGNFGFLNYDSTDENKNNLFFHMSEVKGNNTNIQPGDVVEFVIIHSQRSGKYSACNIVKIGETQAVRPERLTRVKVEESGPKVVVIRNPRGPDGTKGFNSRTKAVLSGK
jgi:cold shock CspA family protein